MAFYRDAFGFDPIGTPAEDGVPEPLQYQLNEQTLLMLIPTGGFGWVLGGREVAPPGISECILTITVGSERDVVDMVDRAGRAGGAVIAEPDHQPWGYSATCADFDGHVWQVVVGSAETV